MRAFIVLVVFLLSATNLAAETSHLAFVSEYVREISVNEALRDLASKDMDEAGENNFSVAIRSSTHVVLELKSQIAMLNGMTLDPPLDTLPPMIADLYGQKIIIHNRMIAIATAFVEGPQPGVDYPALQAELPKTPPSWNFSIVRFYRLPR